VLPLFIFSCKNWRPFLLINVTFYWFHSVVTPPPEGCQPAPFFYLSDLVCPLFYVNLFTLFFCRVSPPWRVSPGAVSLVTPLMLTLITIMPTFVCLLAPITYITTNRIWPVIFKLYAIFFSEQRKWLLWWKVKITNHWNLIACRLHCASVTPVSDNSSC